MNCKPGELAFIVRCPPSPECVGRIVECVEFLGLARINSTEFPDVWIVRWDGHSAAETHGADGYGHPDSWLRPIRDPGDDARDETLEWLPVPSREKEPA